jgi:hypothetical protein
VGRQAQQRTVGVGQLGHADDAIKISEHLKGGPRRCQALGALAELYPVDLGVESRPTDHDQAERHTCLPGQGPADGESATSGLREIEGHRHPRERGIGPHERRIGGGHTSMVRPARRGQ